MTLWSTSNIVFSGFSHLGSYPGLRRFDSYRCNHYSFLSENRPAVGAAD